MEPTDNLRIVDLQVALYAVQSMLDGETEEDAVADAQAAHYSSDGADMPAHALVNLLYSFARTVQRTMK